jgi:protein-S-isoprenylcysteine O-methyltransferase Ste14
MACSLVVVPTWPMLALAVVHFGMTQLKARHEERHLSSVHGAAYRDYVARTGRFLPRLRPRQHRPSGAARRPQAGEEP